MTSRFRITLGQLTPPSGFAKKTQNLARRLPGPKRKRGRCDLVALPEMFLAGYNAQDLVMKQGFMLDCHDHLRKRFGLLMCRRPALPLAHLGSKGKLYNAYVSQAADRQPRVQNKPAKRETVLTRCVIFDTRLWWGRTPSRYPHRKARSAETHIATPCGRKHSPKPGDVLAGAQRNRPIIRGKFETG